MSFNHRRRLALALVLLLSLGGAAPAAMSDDRSMERLDVVTGDGAIIHVVSERPVAAPTARPAVLLVSGAGAFDEDMYFGVSGTERDLVFRDLAQVLVARGFHVVRFAKRGVTCDPNKTRLFNRIKPLENVRPALEPDACLDREILSTVSTETQIQDLLAAYEVAAQASSSVIVIAHSEGFAVLGRAIERGDINPAGVIGVGALLESPESVLQWQMVDRVAGSLEALDQDGDGVTTNQEIRDGYSTSWAAVFDNLSAMLSPAGSWTSEDIEAVRAAWRSMYDQSRDEALSHAPDTLFEIQGRPVASYRWWRSWFTDSTPVAARLRSYVGPVTLIYGDLDSQTPPERQLVAHRQAGATHLRRFVVLPGVGHTLGDNVLMGPIADAERDLLVAEIERLARIAGTAQ